jgi:hypothetical protein
MADKQLQSGVKRQRVVDNGGGGGGVGGPEARLQVAKGGRWSSGTTKRTPSEEG